MPEELTTKKRKQLKIIGHGLNPSIQVGQNGLTQNLIDQMDRDLASKELIKIRFASDDRQERADLVAQITERTRSLRVHSIGRNALLYRESPAQRIKFQN